MPGFRSTNAGDSASVAGGGGARARGASGPSAEARARESAGRGDGVSKAGRGCALRWEMLLSNGPAGWKGSQAESETHRMEAVIWWGHRHKCYNSKIRVLVKNEKDAETWEEPYECFPLEITLFRLVHVSCHFSCLCAMGHLLENGWSWFCRLSVCVIKLAIFCSVLASISSLQNPPEALPVNMPFWVPPLFSSLSRLCLSFGYICVFALRESALFSVGSPCIGVLRCAASLLCLTLFSFLLMRPMLLWQKN